MDNVTAFENEHAERAVLAALMQDVDLAIKISVIQETDFTKQDHRDLFRALRQIAADRGDCTDLITLSDALSRMYGEQEEVLIQLAIGLKNEEVGAKRTFNSHLGILKAASERRQLFDIFDQGKEELRGNGDTLVVMEKTRQALRNMDCTSDSWQSIGDVMAATYRKLERQSKGEEPIMPSGIPQLDRVTTGFHRGELTIIGARPSVGKSAFGMACAVNAARAGYKVGVCSREMVDDQYGIRLFQSGTDISSYKLRTGQELELEDWAKLAEAMGYYQSLPISFLFKTRTVEDLRAEVQQRVDTEGLDLLVVDYAQLMRTREKFDADYLRIGHVSKELKGLTTELHICVLSLAQVGRSAAGNMPSLEELRGSGELEQDADNIIFLHRPENADDDYVFPNHRSLFNTLKKEKRQYIAARIAKQRNGNIGTVSMVFNPEKMMYLGLQNEQ